MKTDPTREAASSSRPLGLFDSPELDVDCDGSLPKTCRDFLASQAVPISLRSLANSAGYEYEFQMAVGRTPEFAETIDRKTGESRGVCLTLDTLASPSDAAACFLSDILETGDHLRKYYLSDRACAGILRRAKTRGKELPPLLKHALERAAHVGEPTS